MSANESKNKPLRIQVHPDDNVAIIVNSDGLKEGSCFEDGLVLVEDVPKGHKVALKAIANGEPIIRYGEIIGYANEDIRKGGWISEHQVELPKAPALDTLPLATKVPEPLPPLEGYTFEGYRNADGSVGTKNRITSYNVCYTKLLRKSPDHDYLLKK